MKVVEWLCFLGFPLAATGSAELARELIPQKQAWDEIVERDGHVRFDVVHRCVVAVPREPDSRATLESIELWHAVPTARPWSETKEPHGALEVSFLPESGDLEYSEEYDSHQVKWTLRGGFDPNAEFAFETKMSVVSCDRTFDGRAAETSWKSYDDSVVKTPDVDRLERIPEKLVRIGEKIRENSDPHEAVMEFCEWIRGEMTYDVRWDHADLEAILDKKAGHCGHFVSLLHALCRVAEVPLREVHGMRLTEEDGLEEELIGIRQDFANRFTWAEVFFPEYGWIEIEPSLQDDPFAIPARFIQNNRWIQNQALQVIGRTPAGEQAVMPLWQYHRTRWEPVYVKTNTIAYSEERHRVANAEEEDGEASVNDAAIAVPKALQGEREWTDVEGRKMVAAVEKFKDEAKRVLIFRRHDGKDFEFPIERLSERDRVFLLKALERD